jgi:hypothetical protein
MFPVVVVMVVVVVVMMMSLRELRCCERRLTLETPQWNTEFYLPENE